MYNPGPQSNKVLFRRVLVPKGTHAIDLSTNMEDELLLQRGLRLRVVRDYGVSDGVRQMDVEVIVP